MKTKIAGKIGNSALPDAPSGLSEAAQRMWQETVQRFVFVPSELSLVESALRAWDRAESARAMVEDEGLTVQTETTGAVRPHPACAIESQARREFRIAWSRLGLVDASGGDR